MLAAEEDEEPMLVGDDDDEEGDNVMDMLKAELALRGKTTNGNRILYLYDA